MRILLASMTMLIFFQFHNIVFGEKYFAEINKNRVIRVIVADNVEWCSRTLGGTWIETFIDNPNRNYAGKGDDYFEIYNNFSKPQPFPSWVMDEKLKWIAPKPRPNDGKRYEWNKNLDDWEVIIRQ